MPNSADLIETIQTVHWLVVHAKQIGAGIVIAIGVHYAMLCHLWWRGAK